MSFVAGGELSECPGHQIRGRGNVRRSRLLQGQRKNALRGRNASYTTIATVNYIAWCDSDYPVKVTSPTIVAANNE